MWHNETRAQPIGTPDINDRQCQKRFLHGSMCDRHVLLVKVTKTMDTVIYCHNPNDNTTQPQPCCSWVGHENDFAHPPHHPPQNSTVTFQSLGLTYID